MNRTNASGDCTTLLQRQADESSSLSLFLPPLAILLLLVSCQSVPDEIRANVALQRESWASVRENRDTIVRAYDAALRKAYDKQLRDYFRRKAAESMPTADGTSELYDRVMAKRAEIWAKLDLKRDEFLRDVNIERGARSAELTAEYLRSVEEGYSAIESLAALAPVARQAVGDLLGDVEDGQ